VDVNLFEPVGISLDQIATLEMLMMFAWLATPEPLGASAMAACTRNVKKVAHRGREPGLELEGPSGALSLQQWGKAILDTLQPLAQWLDSDRDKPLYVAALAEQLYKLEDPELTPSARVMAGIRKTGSFFEHAQELSIAHHQALMSSSQDALLMAEFSDRVHQSLHKQHELEAASTGDFEDYLAAYLGQIHPAAVHT
jgi:glutamate--cysteine ligase